MTACKVQDVKVTVGENPLECPTVDIYAHAIVDSPINGRRTNETVRMGLLREKLAMAVSAVIEACIVFDGEENP